MNRALTFISAAVLAATVATPLYAANARPRRDSPVGAERHRPMHRNFADPSFGNRAGIDYARQTGRCVADLGYGRFEYCGW